MNGTIFHTQQFLNYHNDGKFQFHHLLFYDGKELVAVLAGGLKNEGKVFESPMGASYGSFVTGDISADTSLAIVKAFEDHIISSGVHEVYLTSPPVIYQPTLTQNLDFALLYRGFAYQRHYISHAIEMRDGIVPFARFQPTARKHVRRVLREHPETQIEFVSANEMERGLREFYPILLENKAKFDATPTHSLEDLLRLNELLPDLMKLFLVRVDGEPIAGSLVFVANPRVVIIFYHMLRYNFEKYKPIFLLMDRVTRWAQESGYSFVDIGVSQDTHDENPMTPALSLIRFKEKFDSRGVLRSTMWKSYSS
ncbi:MAG: GNAT family N-acetyltransferase [Ignavibacteriota bacterium]